MVVWRKNHDRTSNESNELVQTFLSTNKLSHGRLRFHGCLNAKQYTFQICCMFMKHLLLRFQINM